MELTDDSKISWLLQSLENSNLPIPSLPLRQQLWYVQQNIVKDGHVFVDQWPEYNNICCLHTSQQFISKQLCDFDVATFYQMKEGSSSTDAEFENFVQNLAIQRQWTTTRSLYAFSIPTLMVNIFRNILGNYGKLETYGEYFCYTALERQNVSAYKKLYDQMLKRLPEELEPDILRPHDLEKVVEKWANGKITPMLPHFFQWLLETFPSACLRNRNENNKLVAWASSYSSGGIALFIEPEYRGQGVAAITLLSIALKLSDFSPIQLCCEISPENLASEKNARKVFPLDLKKSHTLSTWFFFYNQNQQLGSKL